MTGEREDHARPIRVALFGFGGVNRAFSGLVAGRHSLIRQSFGVDLQLVSISRSQQSLLGLASAPLDWGIAAALPRGQWAPDLGTIRSTQNIEAVLAESRPDVVIQAIPSTSIQTARAQLLAALRQRAHAVTATKSALVRGFDDLLLSARVDGRQLRYSAAAAAALPTVDLVNTALRGATITSIEGVLNGNCTFVLSR
jgi:homoserine dehydrogenase